MAKYFKYVTTTNKQKKRIKIPQTPLRPVTVRGGAVEKALLRPRPEGFVLHKRGIYRTKTEDDPYEKLAVPKWQVKGSQPERIVYKKNLDFNLVPGIDFTFQTAADGGRLELGGMVADFVYPQILLVVQVQGPSHTQFIRQAKDSEQKDTISAMGYSTIDLELETIYNTDMLDLWFRRYILRAVNAGAAINYGMLQLGEDDAITPILHQAAVALETLQIINGRLI